MAVLKIRNVQPMLLAVTLLLWVPGVSLAAAPAPILLAGDVPASDVQLGPQGVLYGVVVDVQGVPLSRASVVLQREGRQVATVETDALGRFAVGELQGGTYVVAVGPYVRVLRTWANNTAPPKTRDMALIVVGDGVVRGQRPLLPLERVFASDQFVIAAMAGAAIALPLSVQHSNHRPSSP